MKKLLLIACLVSVSFLLRAQDSKWNVSISPALIQSPAFRYALQPGVEYEFNDRLSLLTEFAVPISKNNSPAYSNTKYFRIKPELRYNLSKYKRGPGSYVGFQASYTFRSWQNTGSTYFDKKTYADSVIRYDGAKINSPILTWSFQFGTLISLTRRLDMDMFIGLGMRMIFTNYSEVENAVKGPYYIPTCRMFPAINYAYYIDGTVKRFHSNFGLRFLYRF